MSTNTTGVDLQEGEEVAIVREALHHIARDIQMKVSPNATIKLPGYGYSLEWMPSLENRFPTIMTNKGIEWTPPALFVRELCMLKLVEEITKKPGWWINVRDAHIAEKWKREILELKWDNYIAYADFTPSMAELCIEELKLKADLYEKTGLIPVLDCSACVIKSDKLVPDTLKRALAISSRKLASDTGNYREFPHGGVIADLVDPSLCPLIYGQSRILPDRKISLTDCLEACGEGDILPKLRNPDPDPEYLFSLYDDCFQWLPCEVTVDGAGNAKIDSYINNLHPTEHANMYSIIEKFITHALPSWDILYRWPSQFSVQRLPITEIPCTCKVPDICNGRGCSPHNMPGEELLRYWQREQAEGAKFELNAKQDASETHIQISSDAIPQESKYENVHPASRPLPKDEDIHLLNLSLERNESEMAIYLRDMIAKGELWCQGIEEERGGKESVFDKWFIDNHPIQFPEPTVGTQCLRLQSPDVRSSGFFLHKNRRLQVIVKLTTIYLTPKNPEYKGGMWETDGLLNEHIVSTAIFCYDADNITDSYLYFGAVTNKEHEDSLQSTQNHPLVSCQRTFAIPPGRTDFQVVGRVLVHPNNAIFYPNIYKHREGSFSLVDRSRSGYRKVLTLYLVDPGIPIISTANVPPQQYHWWTKSSIHNQGVDIVQRLPPELKEAVHNYVDFPIDCDKAKGIRQELITQRIRLGEELHFVPFDQDELDLEHLRYQSSDSAGSSQGLQSGSSDSEGLNDD